MLLLFILSFPFPFFSPFPVFPFRCVFDENRSTVRWTVIGFPGRVCGLFVSFPLEFWVAFLNLGLLISSWTCILGLFFVPWLSVGHLDICFNYINLYVCTYVYTYIVCIFYIYTYVHTYTTYTTHTTTSILGLWMSLLPFSLGLVMPVLLVF